MASPSGQDVVVRYCTRQDKVATRGREYLHSRQHRMGLAFYCRIMIVNGFGHGGILDEIMM